MQSARAELDWLRPRYNRCLLVAQPLLNDVRNAFAQPLLNEVCNALIVLRDPGHDGLSFDHLHVVGNAAYFLGAKPPKLWIVNFLRGHEQVIPARSASASA